MESRVKLFGHPVHPMLIIFPLGLFTTSVLFDLLYLFNFNNSLPTASFYMMGVGVIGGLLAAIFRFINRLALPKNSRARSIGGWHGLGNLVIVVLFAISWLLPSDNLSFIPGFPTLTFSLAGVGLALITSWIGGELVYRLGVGVVPGANVNAPSSLSGKAVVASSAKSSSRR